MTVLGNYLSTGGAFLKWETPGTSYTGVIEAVELRQARKFESTDLAFWDDGSPQMQCLLTLATDYRDVERDDDDGTRMLSINLWSGQKKSLVAACKAAGVAEPQVGQKFTVTHVSGIGNAKSPREFLYVLTDGPTGIAEVLSDEPAPAPATSSNPADTAKALIASGVDDVTIASATGLPLTVIAALRNVA